MKEVMVMGSAAPALSSSSCHDAFSSWNHHGHVRRSTAESMCQAMGARSCRRTELIPAAGGTGCNFDHQYVWTSTRCGGGYLRVQGGNANDFECKESGQMAAVRCCADRAVGTTLAPYAWRVGINHPGGDCNAVCQQYGAACTGLAAWPESDAEIRAAKR
eukprot:gene56710-biopygen45491